MEQNLIKLYTKTNNNFVGLNSTVNSLMVNGLYKQLNNWKQNKKTRRINNKKRRERERERERERIKVIKNNIILYARLWIVHVGGGHPFTERTER